MVSGFTIRRAANSDSAAIARLNKDFFSVAGMETTAEEFCTWMNHKSHTIIVAQSENDVVGYLAISHSDKKGFLSSRFNRFMYLSEIVVAPMNRGQGLGSALIKCTADFLRSDNQDNRRLTLAAHVHPDNFPSKHMLYRSGFKLVGYENDFYLNGDAAEMFSKKIKEASYFLRVRCLVSKIVSFAQRPPPQAYK